ncbi:MAG TPA: cache domain-containing protein [Thermodesulfovibrionales bacterium]|nr:cache domain-containing protein [Thermodesulfovibrionales bacterium]
MVFYRGGLQRRITLAVTLGMSVILLSFGVVSYTIIQKNIEESLEKKLAMARLIRNNIDTIIKDNINRLYDISLSGRIDLNDTDFGPEKEALSTAYRYSIFTDGVFIVDKGGNVLLNYPERMRDASLNVLSVEPISRMLAIGKPVVSNIYTTEMEKRRVLYVLIPLRDKNGNEVGMAGGEIDPTSPLLANMLRLIDIGQNRFIDIVDSNGVIIASSQPSRTLTRYDHDQFFHTVIQEKRELVVTCHQCHESRTGGKSANILAFSPLATAPWGIAVQEPERDVFAPVTKLKWTFVALSIVFIGTAFILTIGTTRSIVKPIKELIHATDRIAKGELSTPLSPEGADEVGILGRSFETMRMRLVESIERVKKYNIELEARVRERTAQIRESRKRIQNLLKKIISTQEDERKRIARELHDLTIQELSAILMRVDICKLYPENLTVEKIDEIRRIVLNALDGVHTITQNLRPSVLDDLGLQAAIKRLLEMNLGEKGINYYFTATGLHDMRFGPEIETSLFRIIQEAVVNIARHANAENVTVTMEISGNAVSVRIEDDGEGFDVDSLLHQTIHYKKDGRGLGLLGMTERAASIEGTLCISSTPGRGTKMTLDVPLKTAEIHDV